MKSIELWFDPNRSLNPLPWSFYFEMRTKRKESEKIKGFDIERKEIREMGKKFVRDVWRERLWVQWFHSFRLWVQWLHCFNREGEKGVDIRGVLESPPCFCNGLETIYITSSQGRTIDLTTGDMGLEFRYVLGKVLGTQDHPTPRLASHYCVLHLKLGKIMFNTYFLNSHTH